MDRRITGILILLLVFGLVACSQETEYGDEFNLPPDNETDERMTLKFGRVPSVTVTELLRQNAPLIRQLKNELDVNITYRFADSYHGIIDGMSEETYDFTWMGPYSYVLAECSSETSARYRPLVRPVRQQPSGEAQAEYRSLIFARAGSSIRELEDLRGKSFAFVEEQSTSGYLFPLARLTEANLNPESDFENVEFLGRHDRVVQSVLDGTYDAGAVYDDARLEEFDSPSKADEWLRVIARTRPIPTSPITVSGRFAENHPELVDQFVETMTSLHRSKRGEEILTRLGIQRYQPVSDEDYDEVRNVLRTLLPRLTEIRDRCQGRFSS
jgi:phosphonate transport system substrate-binding protein